MAATQISVRVVKEMPYRDGTIRFSNRYYFDKTSVADSDAWHNLFDAIVLQEKAIHTGAVTIVECIGYGPGSAGAVATKTYTTAGTLAGSNFGPTPGDCAVVLRMATTKQSTKNHPVFVFSYFHRAYFNSSGSDSDTLHATQKAAVETYAGTLQSGISANSQSYKRTTPDGHATTGHTVDPYIGHRDFPR